MAMRFFAKTATGASSGDFFQLYFGATQTEGEPSELDELDEPKGPFLLIGRQFEFPDGGRCTLDSSDEELQGEYRVKLLALSQSGLTLDVLADRPRRVEVSFELNPIEYGSLRRFVDVVLGNAEAFDEDL